MNLKDLSINEQSDGLLKCENPTKKLDVYYCIDLDFTQDIDYIENILNLNIKVNKREFLLDRFERVKINELVTSNSDVIRSGLLTFNKMFRDLKLKSTNDVWFVYITKGNIKEVYKDVFVTLLNKNPSENVCVYAINKNNIMVNKKDEKDVRLLNLKEINKTINELLVSNNSITYKNLVM